MRPLTTTEMQKDEENEQASPPASSALPEAELQDEAGNGESSDTDDSSGSEDKSDDLDGHRPALREIRSSYSSSYRRNRRSTRSLSRHGTRASAATGTSLNTAATRRTNGLGWIRSRATTGFTHPLAHAPTTADCLVDFDGPDDPYKPINWPMRKKIVTTMLYGLVTMSATWASSSYSVGTQQVADEFKVGTQVAVLGTTLFLFGFGLGPLIWAPLSEVFGRRLAVMVPMFVAVCFSFGSATSKDLQTLMITRFFGAFFASAPVTNTGGVLGDLFSPAHRGIAMAGYAMAVVGGPSLGKYLPSG